MSITHADMTNKWMTATMLNIRDTMIDNWSKGHPVLDQFKRKNAIDREDGIADENNSPGVIVPISKGASNNGRFMRGPYDTIRLKPTNKEGGARYFFKHYTNGIVIAYLHELANSGKKKRIDLLKQEKKRLDVEVPEQIDRSLIWDVIEGGPTGLVHLAWPYNENGGTVTALGEGGVDQSTAAWNVVGGIDSSVDTLWRNKVQQAVPLSVMPLSDQMDELNIEIIGEGCGAPDLWIVDKIAYKVLVKESKNNTVVQSTGKLSKIDLGYPVLYYNGNEIIYATQLINPDSAARGIVFAVNTKFTRYTIWNAMDNKIMPFTGPWKGSNNQLTRESAFMHSFCMTTSNRRTLGVIPNVLTA